MGLRPQQVAALDAIKDNFKQGVNRQLAVMPTGFGKTVVFANVKQWLRLPMRKLVLAHREELVEQARDKIAKWNPGLRVGVEKAKRTYRDTDDVVVASVSSIGRSGCARLLRFQPEQWDALVTDEAHHSTASSYQTIYKHFGLLDGRKDILSLGVTATPKRPDGTGLDKTFDKIVYQYTLLQAIKDGWLSNLRGYRIRTETTLDCVRTLAGDFKQDDLASVVNNVLRNELIALEWYKRANDRTTIVFTVDIEHAKRIAEAFTALGISADAVWGSDPNRAEKLEKLRDGRIRVLANCGVLTEGFDDWAVGCIVLARPTKSNLLFTQMVGRGARIEDGIGNLLEWLAAGNTTSKQDCLVLDVADNTTRHCLVSLCDLFGLPTKVDLKGKTVTDAMDLFESASANHPDTDLSQCLDVEGLQTYAEEVNLFRGKFVPEVMENSELQWHRTPMGNYLLMLPWRERVTIWQDLLGHWEIKGTVDGNIFEASTKHLDAAFNIADQKVKQLGGRLRNIACRKSTASWADEPITAAEIKTLKWQLDKRGESYPDFGNMTRGDAGLLLNKLISGA